MPNVLLIDELEPISNRRIARRLRSHHHGQLHRPHIWCKGLVLHLSQFKEGSSSQQWPQPWRPMRLEVTCTLLCVLLYLRRYRNGKRILPPHIKLVYMPGTRGLGGGDLRYVAVCHIGCTTELRVLRPGYQCWNVPADLPQGVRVHTTVFSFGKCKETRHQLHALIFPLRKALLLNSLRK